MWGGRGGEVENPNREVEQRWELGGTNPSKLAGPVREAQTEEGQECLQNAIKRVFNH